MGIRSKAKKIRQLLPIVGAGGNVRSPEAKAPTAAPLPVAPPEMPAQPVDVNAYFDEVVNEGNSLMRSIHYPAVASSEKGERAGAHEDINLITLLIGAEEGGLEILNNDGRWIKVNPSSNAIVCNIGDMLQLVTGNKLKSTTHRVMNYENHGNKSRYSIPFFLHPSPNTLLKSIYDHADEGVLAHDFLNERLKAIKLY